MILKGPTLAAGCRQVVYGRVKRAALLQQLREHLRRNLVRFGKTWHCQTRGIPQVPTPPVHLPWTSCTGTSPVHCYLWLGCHIVPISLSKYAGSTIISFYRSLPPVSACVMHHALQV